MTKIRYRGHTLLKPEELVTPNIYHSYYNCRIAETGEIYRPFDNYWWQVAEFPNDAGYLLVELQPVGHQGTLSRRVHKLLAEIFIPNPNNYPMVHHKDHDKQNYALDNLEWTTYSANTKSAYDSNVIPIKRGHAVHNSKQLALVVDNEIVEVYGSYAEAAERNGIARSSCSAAVRDGRVIKGLLFKEITRQQYNEFKKAA